jgi:c-di-GMP-binding flagellar brake protein YcgR
MTDERRRYFRIDDSMGISYRRMSQQEAKAFVRLASEQGGEFDLAANFDNRIETLLDACRIQSPLAAELVDLINKKLNFAIQQTDINSELIQQISYTLRTVNISACGMAFECEEVFDKGQILQLDIKLYPSELHLVALAEVVDCSAHINDSSPQQSEAGYFARLNFSEINNHDQELLIQHIVKRQGLLLKQRRHRMNESD